jgi:hypothetical protein
MVFPVNKCNAYDALREAQRILLAESDYNSSRALSMTLSKIDEAIMWRLKDLDEKVAKGLNHAG